MWIKKTPSILGGDKKKSNTDRYKKGYSKCTGIVVIINNIIIIIYVILNIF